MTLSVRATPMLCTHELGLGLGLRLGLGPYGLVKNSPTRDNILLRDRGLFIYAAHNESPKSNCGGCDFAFR